MIGRRVQQEYLSNELKNLPGEDNTVASTLAIHQIFHRRSFYCKGGTALSSNQKILAFQKI
jgi:hypothetical protein